MQFRSPVGIAAQYLGRPNRCGHGIFGADSGFLCRRSGRLHALPVDVALGVGHPLRAGNQLALDLRCGFFIRTLRNLG